MLTQDEVFTALKEVIDPELGTNVVELGLIRDVSIADNQVEVKMVLTMAGCPLAHYLISRVKQAVESVAEGRTVNVELLQEEWAPPWLQETGS